MAKPQEQQTSIPSNTTPTIIEHEQEGSDIAGDYHHDDAFSGNWCGCFRLFCCFDNHRRQDGETAGLILHHSHQDLINKDNWMMKRVKSLKELSEIVAGPKWKNFIRKFSKRPRRSNTPFQYDPQSYALNFNDGINGGNDDEEDEFLHRSFSTRFAPPLRSTAS